MARLQRLDVGSPCPGRLARRRHRSVPSRAGAGAAGLVFVAVGDADRRGVGHMRSGDTFDELLVADEQPGGAAARLLFGLLELNAGHPELLLERTKHLDQDVLRDNVELAESIHAGADSLNDLGESPRELA
jgi:hypothetical protein